MVGKKILNNIRLEITVNNNSTFKKKNENNKLKSKMN